MKAKQTYKFLIYSFLIYCFGVFAGLGYCRADNYVNLHLASYHGVGQYYATGASEPTPYNQINPGLGIGYGLTDNIELRAGGYKNSFYTNSFYTGAAIYTSQKRLMSFGLQGGVVTGYQDSPEYDKILRPFIIPTVLINYGRARTEIGYLPGEVSVITISTGVRF